MIFKTEREKADFDVEQVKSFIKSRNLDYILTESPFGLNLSIKKKYLRDFSSKLIQSPISSSPIHDQNKFSASEFPTFSDSGIHSEDISRDLAINDLKEKLVKSTNQIKSLEERMFAKDNIIKELESKMKTYVTDTLNANKDVETKDKIILSLNFKIKSIDEEKSKIKS